MASAMIASWCFYNYQSITMSILGLVFMTGWHVLDGADGQLARLTGKTSEFGKVIDGLCDHLGFGMVYVALALALQPQYGTSIWLLAIAAGLSHALQAGALEFHRDNYDCWVHGNTGKCSQTVDPIELNFRSGIAATLLRAGHCVYVRLQQLVSEPDNELISAERELRGHPDRGTFGKTYQAHSLRSVHLWTLLSSNKRTIALSLFCMAKIPVLFFLYEIILLNGVLIWLRRTQRRTNRNLRDALLNHADGTVDRTAT
jgi:hypothetical protein